MPETTSAVDLIALNLTNLITFTSHITSNNYAIENPVQAAKRRRILSRSVSGQNVNCNAEIAFPVPKPQERILIFRFKRQKFVFAFIYLSYEPQYQGSMWQFAKSGSRLRGLASAEPSFLCEGVLLSAFLEQR
jgi:hypothetical protein